MCMPLLMYALRVDAFEDASDFWKPYRNINSDKRLDSKSERGVKYA